MLWLDVLLGFVSGIVSLFTPRGFTRVRGSLEEMAARHPRSVVRRAEFLVGPWAVPLQSTGVEFVIANRRGLSFRDGHGGEELRIAHDDLGDIDLLPTDGFAGQRIRVTGRDGVVRVEFWSPHDAGDVHTDVSAAITR